MGSTGLIRFYIYFQFSCHHIYYQKGKKIENFQFSMLKFTISVSNLYMKPIWARPPLNFLPVITIIWNYPYPKFQRPTQSSILVSRAPKLANFSPKFQKWQILQTHRFCRPHYSNSILNVQRQLCPVF